MDWDPTTHYKEVAIAERYDQERFSHFAGRVFNALEKNNVRKAFAPFPRDGLVLDLPCGTGRLAEVLLEDGFRIVGVDISPAMVHVAQRRLARFADCFQTKVADVLELAKREQKVYDLALCARVLMHFPLPQQIEFLKSVAQLTKGAVVFTQSLSTPYHRGRRGFKRLIGRPAPANFPITEQDLAALLQGAGLRETRRLRPCAPVTEEIIVISEPR